MTWVEVMIIGGVVGYLGGLFGKGGSAIATPLLAAIGLPAIVAVAAPLPAAVPGTLAAYRSYRHLGIVDHEVIRLSVVAGVPATVLGALFTLWIDAEALVVVTEIALVGLGVRILASGQRHEVVPEDVAHRRGKIVAVAAAVGLVSGLLANAGGFLFVPLYLGVVRLPIKTALACSLGVAAALAVPGTIVHAALGHVDWAVTAVFASAAIPLSSAGARTAVRMNSARLERIYGAGVSILGLGLLVLA